MPSIDAQNMGAFRGQGILMEVMKDDGNFAKEYVGGGASLRGVIEIGNIPWGPCAGGVSLKVTDGDQVVTNVFIKNPSDAVNLLKILKTSPDVNLMQVDRAIYSIDPNEINPPPPPVDAEVYNGTTYAGGETFVQIFMGGGVQEGYLTADHFDNRTVSVHNHPRGVSIRVSGADPEMFVMEPDAARDLLAERIPAPLNEPLLEAVDAIKELDLYPLSNTWPATEQEGSLGQQGLGHKWDSAHQDHGGSRNVAAFRAAVAGSEIQVAGMGVIPATPPDTDPDPAPTDPAAVSDYSGASGGPTGMV